MSKDQVSALVLLALAAAAGLLGWACGVFDGEPHPSAYDAAQRSTDLPVDLKLMWETESPQDAADPTEGSTLRASTDRAINAASRVFNSIRLIGRSRSEVSALLGQQNSARDGQTFDPTSTEEMVYRFDRGAYGWQFKVLFDGRGKVQEVQRRWVQ